MPSSVVRTFSDPDDYASTIREGAFEITVTGRGNFVAQLIRIDLHRVWTNSSAGSWMAPHWEDPSLLACPRWPGPRGIISPPRISIPDQIGAGRSPRGRVTKSTSSGTVKKAMRERYSS